MANDKTLVRSWAAVTHLPSRSMILLIYLVLVIPLYRDEFTLQVSAEARSMVDILPYCYVPYPRDGTQLLKHDLNRQVNS